MGTEDDLKRLGQAAAALAGVAAARAKDAAEQLIGSREKARGGAKTKAENLVEEGRRGAAEVIGALRREVLVILHDLQNLENNLRGHEKAAGTNEAKVANKTAAAPAKKTAAATKSVPVKKVPASKEAAPTSKAASARKAGGTRKAAGSGRTREGLD
jgi:hypothetical protein